MPETLRSDRRTRATDGADGLDAPDALRLAALEAQREKATAALAVLERQAVHLGTWLGDTLAAGSTILSSMRWRLGDLLIQRIAKPLLRWHNRTAPWAPEGLAELQEAHAAWRQRAVTSLTLAVADEADGAARERIRAAEAELRTLNNAREKARVDLVCLVRRVDAGLTLVNQLLESKRWRVGDLLLGKARRAIGHGGRVERALSRVSITRLLIDAWRRDAGRVCLRPGASLNFNLGEK